MTQRAKPRKGLLVLFGLAVFTWWVRYHPPWVDLLIFDDDARQHVYWTARFQDPSLFQDDLLTDFIVSSGFDPLGYRLLYRLGTRFMDPLPFSQLLSLLLLLVSLWLLYELATEIILHSRGRIICCGLFLFYSLYCSSGGLPRGFAFPLLLVFLVLSQKGAYKTAAITMPVAVLFYPPVLLNILALAVWELVFRRVRRVKRRRFMLDLAILTLIVMVTGIYVLSVYETVGEVRGEQVTFEQARAMPEFHAEGRSAFFRDNRISYLLLGRSGIGAYHVVGFAAILVVIGLIGGFGRLRVPTISFDLVWTSFVLFGAAHLLLFRLHLPSRYTMYTLPLAFMLAIGASTEVFRDRSCVGGQLPNKTRWRSSFGWVVAAVLAIGYGYIQGHLLSRADPQLVTLDRANLEMLVFIETLPKDSLTAGHPMDMDNVPLVARKRVLVNHELSIPYYLGYYRQIRSRMKDMLQAYYATVWEEVEGFVDRYGVDALVVQKAHFRKDFLDGPIYFEPFNSAVKRRWQGDEHFVLADPPQRLRCFENERYVVLCWGRSG